MGISASFVGHVEVLDGVSWNGGFPQQTHGVNSY